MSQPQKQTEPYDKCTTAKHFLEAPWTFFRVAFAPVAAELRKMPSFSRSEFSLLDHGCGSGRAMRLLRNLYHIDRISGIDTGAAMIDEAKKTDVAHASTYTHLPNPELSLPYANESFHAIISFWVWGYMSTPTALVGIAAESHRILKTNGRLFIIVNNPHVPYWKSATGNKTYGEPNRAYGSGDLYPVVLQHSDGNAVRLENRFWTVADYVRALESGGFHRLRCFTPAYYDADVEAELALLRSRGLMTQMPIGMSHNIGEEISTLMIVAEK